MKISPRNNYCVCARRTSQLLLFMLFHLSCCISLKQKVYGIKTTRDLFCFSWKLTLNPLRNHDFQFSIRVCCCFGCAIGRIIKKIDPKSFRGPETKVRPLSGRDRVICSARGLEMNPISRPKFHFDLFVCLQRWCRCFSWRAYNRGDGWTGQIIDIYMQSAWKKRKFRYRETARWGEKSKKEITKPVLLYSHCQMGYWSRAELSRVSRSRCQPAYIADVYLYDMKTDWETACWHMS